MQDVYHVGFPKCASTLLQQKLFPLLHSEQKIIYSDRYNYIRNQIEYAPISSSKIVPLSCHRHPSNANVFSYEGISHMANDWGPCFWEPSFELAKDFIPKNARILFVLRKPSDYLLSCFKHSLRLGELHNSINSFFLNSCEHPRYYQYYGALASKRHFNLSKFNLVELKDMWSSYFTDVNFILLDSSFIDSLLSFLGVQVSESVHSTLMDIYSSTKSNKAISDLAVHLSLMRSELLFRSRFHTTIGFSPIKFIDYSLKLFSTQQFLEQSQSLFQQLIRSIYKESNSSVSYQEFFYLNIVTGWKEALTAISDTQDKRVLDFMSLVPDYRSEIQNLDYPHKKTNQLFYDSLKSHSPNKCHNPLIF